MIVPFAQLALAGLLSFALGRLLAPYTIAWLRLRKLGDRPREELALHQAKAGTPTMGGILLLAPICLLGLLNTRFEPSALPMLAGLLLFGALGAIDDWRKLNSGRGLGFQVRWKFLLHGLVALGLALWVVVGLGVDRVFVPLIGEVATGALGVPLAALAIFSTVAGVNETDGLDGLSSGVTLFVALALLLVALWQGAAEVAVVLVVTIGALLAFLWSNAHPAAVFMGDTGSLALGALIGVAAVQLGLTLLLPIIGIVYVMELGSVILQVAYFKRTGGKRIFKMSPIHHHFELSGWPETQVVLRFWIISALGGLTGLALYFWSR